MKLPIFPNIEGVRFAHIPNHPGYAASDDGRIWTCKFNRWGYRTFWSELATSINNRHGRRITHLGRGNAIYLHHAVLLAFVGPKPDGMECLHINGDATDNRLCNLRWGAKSENMADLRRHGSRKGEKHVFAKLTADMVRDIRRRVAQGETHQSVADRYNVKREAVSKIVRRERWAHID